MRWAHSLSNLMLIDLLGALALAGSVPLVIWQAPAILADSLTNN